MRYGYTLLILMLACGCTVAQRQGALAGTAEALNIPVIDANDDGIIDNADEIIARAIARGAEKGASGNLVELLLYLVGTGAAAGVGAFGYKKLKKNKEKA